MSSRPVCARAIRKASSLASLPEFTRNKREAIRKQPRQPLGVTIDVVVQIARVRIEQRELLLRAWTTRGGCALQEARCCKHRDTLDPCCHTNTASTREQF